MSNVKDKELHLPGMGEVSVEQGKYIPIAQRIADEPIKIVGKPEQICTEHLKVTDEKGRVAAKPGKVTAEM